MSDREPVLLWGEDLEHLSQFFGWSFSKRELIEGYPRRTIESWINSYRRAGLSGVEITFSESTPCYGWYSDRIGACIDWDLVKRDHPNKIAKVEELDFGALSKFVPTYHCPAWPRPRFWSQHWTDVIWHAMSNPALQRRYRRVAQRGMRVKTIDYLLSLDDGVATVQRGHAAGIDQAKPMGHLLSKPGLYLP